MRLSGNKGQYFLYEGRKLMAFHMLLQCFEYANIIIKQNKM